MEDLQKKNPGTHILPQFLPFGACFEEQKNILDSTIDLMMKMRKKTKKGYSKMLPFQIGIVMSCRALPMLYRDLKNRFPNEDVTILTYRLNQDALENLFSVLRSAGGTNTNPSPVDFQYRLTNFVLGKSPEAILKRSNTNVALEQGERPVLSAQV
jgi:hypothetical protein